MLFLLVGTVCWNTFKALPCPCIYKAQNCIAGKIDTLDRIINNEIIRKENLSPDQSRIDTAVDIIKGIPQDIKKIR